MKNLNFSILGTCVSRDSFSIPKDINYDPNYNFAIKQYVFAETLSSLLSKKSNDCDILINEIDKVNLPNSLKRSYELMCKKECFNFLFSTIPDYLVIDLTTFVFPTLYCDNTAYSSRLLRVIFNDVQNKGSIPLLTKLLDNQQVFEFKNECDYLSKFKIMMQIILKKIKQKNIIILKSKGSNIFINNGSIDLNFYNCSAISDNYENNMQSKLFDYLKSNFSHMHFIDSLPITVCNSNHKFGKYKYHFIDEVYCYYYDALKIITAKSATRASENKKLINLSDEYNKKISYILNNAAQNSILRTSNSIDIAANACEGFYILNGVKIRIDKNGEFSLEGKAINDTCIFLYSGNKNPFGPWNEFKINFPKGNYIFATNVASNKNCYIQLVLGNKEEKRWIYGGYLSNSFTLDNEYSSCLIRIMITKNTNIDIFGKISIVKI